MRAAGRPALEWLVALLISAAALLLFLNGSFFSAYGSLHIDLSINLVASHALREGSNPYGPFTLYDRAVALGSPTDLVYSQLFTSYIQPPTSALSLLPLTTLPWREATRVYLVLNNVFLLAAVGLTLYTVRPALPLRWVLAGASLLVLLYSQIYGSFALGQVDATLTLLLAIAFSAYVRRRPAIAGCAVAIAAAIKLIPALLLLYFLWRRNYRAAAWGLGAGAVLFLASLAYVGTDVYRTYLTETLPALTKGSTHYANASLGALIARAQTPEVIGDLPEMVYLDEVQSSGLARIGAMLAAIAALGSVALVLGNRPPPETRSESRIVEFYLVIAVGLIISSVTWEFYVVWLLPLFAAVFLAPQRVLAGPPALRLLFAGAFVLAFIGLNYPGDCGVSPDCYLFDRNDIFYHPEWVPGAWVEERVRLYHDHLDAVLFLRLPTLFFLAATLSALILARRWQAARAPARLPVEVVT